MQLRSRTQRAPAAARLGGRGRGGRPGEQGRHAGRVRHLDLQHGVPGVVGAEGHALHGALDQPAARPHQALQLRPHLHGPSESPLELAASTGLSICVPAFKGQETAFDFVCLRQALLPYARPS